MLTKFYDINVVRCCVAAFHEESGHFLIEVPDWQQDVERLMTKRAAELAALN